MGWFGKSNDNNEQEVSTGQEYQCDCTHSGCPCTRWEFVRAGRVIPLEFRCSKCLRNDHSG